MATNSKADENPSITTAIDNHLRSIVYNPSLNSLIYLNDKQEIIVRSADQLSTLFHRTLPLNNTNEYYEIISCHDKFLLLTSTHIHVRQLYQGLYFLDSTIGSINDENCHVLIELTYGDAQLLIQLLATLDLSISNHISEFYDLLKKKFSEHVSSSSWNLLQFSYDCLNAIKICFDILRLYKQQIQQNQNMCSPLPGIVVVGLLLDYLTRYYHHKKSSVINTDEQIGSTLETPSSPSSVTATTTPATPTPTVAIAAPLTSMTTPPSSFFNAGGRTTRERLMFSEATRYRTFTLWPHAAYRWLSPESMAKAGFYYSPLKDNDDRALCFACTVTLVCWEPSDSPWTEHGRHSPNCPFIKGDFTENVPLRTTCSIQPGKKIFSNQQQQKWLIKSNELISNERNLLFLNSDWILRSVDITNVIHIKTIISLKNLIEQLTTENIPEENYFSENTTNNETVFIKQFDRLTSRRYFNSKFIPLAITMYPLPITTDSESYIIFYFVQIHDSNKCLLITTTTLNHYDNTIPSRTSTITNSPQTEEPTETTTLDEQTKTNNKYDYLIEFSNFKRIPKQAFLYQLTKTKMLLLINTTECIHGYGIEYDQTSLTLKVVFYHCIYQSSTNDIDIDSINSIVLDDDDLINTDEQSIISDNEENLEIERDDNIDGTGECQNKDQYSNKILKRKCFLICFKSGYIMLYDVYRSMGFDTNQEDNNIGILADRQTIGSVEKCVHIRGTDTIYAWIIDIGVKKFNIRDIFPTYFTNIQSDDRRTTSSINPSHSKSSTDDQNSYSISTLRSLLSFASFDSSPVTYFFAQVNSSYWIDTLDTTKTNIDRHTWRLQQPQINQQPSVNQQVIPCVHVFDIQTATPCILHTIEFRYTLNRQHLYKKTLFVTLYRYSNEQNEVDQKIEFNQLNSKLNFSNDDILAGPYSLIDYLESPTHDQGLIQLCSYDLLTYKSKYFRLVLESKCSSTANQSAIQQSLFPIEIISITLRSTKHQARLLRLYDNSTINCLTSTILTTRNEKKILFSLNLLISIIYTTNNFKILNQIKFLLLNETFLQHTFINASRTIAKRMVTLILMIIKIDDEIEKFIDNFLNLFQMNNKYLLGFKSSSALKCFFIIIGQWTNRYQYQIGTKLLQWSLQLADVIKNTDTAQRQLLRNKFGFYADPFDAHLFDVDLATLIECSLRQRNSNSSSSTSSNSTNAAQSSRPAGMNDNCYDPRIYSRYGTTGLPIIPCDPDSLYSFVNVQYALAKLLPNSLSSSNAYLKPIPDLFEISPLNYTVHSSSDGTRLECVDMTHLLTLRTYEATNAPPPPPPNVTLTAGSHTLYHPTTSSSIYPPQMPPAISTFNSSHSFPFSFPTPNINTYYDTLYMLPPTTTNPQTSNNDTSTSATVTFPITTPTTMDNLINHSLSGSSPWLPHLASKFKDKQGLQKEKLKLIAKKNKAASTQSSILKKNSSLFTDLIHHSSKSSSSSSLVQNQQTFSTNPVSSTNKNRIDDENLEQQRITVDDILTEISNNIYHGQYLPLYQFIIDRLSSGSRSYFVLDFGKQVTLTDILIPSCHELASLSLDFWSHGEHIDCQRLFSSTHIATQPFFLHDLQPAIIARYIRITLIGQSNISVSSTRLPVGYFFGYPYILNDDNDSTNNSNTTNNNNEKYAKKLQSIEGIYETLISNYALCRQKLFNILSSMNNVEKSFIENIYQECIQLQIQINHASRQISQCRAILKMDSIQNSNQQPTSDYLKLLADLLTSELTSLSGIMQQTDSSSSSSSFISLNDALQIFDTFAIRHVQIIDMPKRLLQLCSYHTWWPEFVKECFQRYFLNNELLTIDQQQSLFISLIDLCEQTLLTIKSPNDTTLSYNRLLAIEYINNIYNLLMNTNNNYQSIEWLLLFIYRLSEKNLFPYSFEQINKKTNFSQLINKNWQFLHTSSIIQSPRLTNSTNNYRRKLRKETLLKKSTKPSSSSSSVTTLQTQTQTQTSTIIVSPTSSIDSYCYRSLVLQVAQYLIQVLIQNKNLSNELFILICKSLSDISRSCKPFLLLNEYISKDDLMKLILNTEQVWIKHAFNYFLIDSIDNEIWLPNEINHSFDDDDNDEIDIDDDKEVNDEWTKKKHFPAFKKSKKKPSTQQILVQFQNKAADQDILYPTTDDFLVLLSQSSFQQQPALGINLINNTNYDVIPFSIDNRLDGNMQFIFDLFTINQTFKIQTLLNKNLFQTNQNSIEYNLNIKHNSQNQCDINKFFSQTTIDLLNEIFQTMLCHFIEQNQFISFEIFNTIEHLLSSYLIISLANYSKNMNQKQLSTQTEIVNNNQPPININLKPLFIMSIDTLGKLLKFLLGSSLITIRVWHHLFSLLYYTSTNTDLAKQMKQLWFKGDIENSLFAKVWLKFIQTTPDMIDESTVDIVINYFERLFMCDDENINIMENIKLSKRVATSDGSPQSQDTSSLSSTNVNSLYLDTLLSILDRLIINGFHGPLNCHLKFLNYLLKQNFSQATSFIRLKLCRNIIDLVWSFCYSYSPLSFTQTDIHPLICFLNYDRIHQRQTASSSSSSSSSSNSLIPPSSVNKWQYMNTVNKLSMQNNPSSSSSSAAATINDSTANSKSTSTRRQCNLHDTCIRQMILLVTKLMENKNESVDQQRKRFKIEENDVKTIEIDGEHSDDILESIYIEKLLSILSMCHSSLDSSPSISLNSSTKFLAASITSTNQYSSFIHTTIHLNLNDLISVGDSIYYCLSSFISQPSYLLPILCHYLTTHPLLSSPLLLFIIYSIHNSKILSEALKQYKLIDLLVNNLITYSNYLSNQTQIPSIQRIYDQRQSSNNTMDIGSINLSPQCQITCSNPSASSPEILLQSNNNLQTALPSSSRRLRSPPWSYTYQPNEQRCTLTVQFPYSIILKSIQIIPFTQLSMNHYTIIDQLNTNLTQYPSSITCEISSDGYYFIPCAHLLNTQGQQIINLSLTKQIDVVRQLRIHFYKPMDHDTIGLQQISIYGYYAYDQQMIIEQTSHPYQTLISTVYGKQVINTSKSSNSPIVTTLNDDDIKLMYSSIKSSTINSNSIDNSHQVSMILADKYRSFNHYLQLIHLCLKNTIDLDDNLFEKFLFILKEKLFMTNNFIFNEIFIFIGNHCMDKQFELFLKYLLNYNHFNILSELSFNETNINYLINNTINNEIINEKTKQTINNILWKIKEDHVTLDENLLAHLLTNFSWLLPAVAHHRPLLAMNYINKNDLLIEYFEQLKICSLSVEFLNEVIKNEYFIKSIEELNQQIQLISNKTSNQLLIYHALDYLITISKYSNVQTWFSQTRIASDIWKNLLDIFNSSNISSFIQSPSILLTQLITLLRNLSMQCPTNQTNMSLISSYLAYLTERRLEQDRPLTGYLQYILSEVVLKYEYIQCLINTRDYPINIREYSSFPRNSLYHKLIQDCSISMNVGQLIEKLFGFNYLQANIWTATNYIKNKSYLIKASSEPITSNHRRKIPRAELLSLRSTITGKLTTKSIGSLSTLAKHQKLISKSTTNELSIPKKTSSLSLVENVHFMLHVNGQKKQCILPKTTRLSDLLLSFDCRSLNTYEVDVIEFSFDNHVLTNDSQENDLITHKLIVENKDYPTLLDTFVHANGLKILAQHFARNYPSIQSYDECLTSSSAPNTNIFDKVNFFDFSSLVSTSSTNNSNNMTMPYYVFITFSIFLRLPNYARAMLKNRALACNIIRLMLGQKESILNDRQDQTQNHQESFDMRQLSKLPFETLSILLKESSNDLLDEILHSSILLLLLSCLSSITHHPHRKQKDALSTPISSLTVPPVALSSSSTTTTGAAAAAANNPTIIDDNDDEYYEDDIEQIESTTIQQLNTINNSNHNNANPNSNFWAKGTGFGTGSTHSQWKSDEIIQIQKLHEEHVIYLFDIFCSIFSDKLSEELLDENLIEIINTSCLIPVLESYLRNDSILDISKQGDIHRHCLRLVNCLLHNNKLKSLIYQTSNIESLIENLLQCVQTYTSMIQIDDDEQLNLFSVELKQVYDKIKQDRQIEKENSSQFNINHKQQLVTLEEFYSQTMKLLQFSTYPITIENESGEKILFNKAIKYHYEDMVRDALTINSMQRIKRLAQEQITISTSLPLSFSSTIFVRSDENRMDVMKILMTGPDGTPYSNGCFVFDVYFPNEYPTTPPSINLETTGNHTVRFNPNLYNDGKVCLSILNTWHGRPEEKWNSTSTFLQVLVSIQSLIFVPEPYFNEPGYERTRGTATGTAQSLEYDANIRQATVRWAMLEQLRNPPACFADIVRRHFFLKRNEIIDQCDSWIRELQDISTTEKRISSSISQHVASLIRHTSDLKKELVSLILPDDFEIPSELTARLLNGSSNNNITDQATASSSSISSSTTASTITTVAIPSLSDTNKKSEQLGNSSTDEHAVQIKIVPNLQYQLSSSSVAATAASSTTVIDTETQQSSNSSTDNYEQQQSQSSSTNTNTYNVTITHSNSLISDWTTTGTQNVPLVDDGLIYDDLLDDEDDLDDDLDIEDMLEYEGEIPETYPEDFY
ncbi:unnamed protein product [Rotaria magnacalcarata]|uniref:UBC core domain-containing protein n=2 Tax=Rotaria magnacalcarata TaxID=392030 RepID=A0A816PY80_9BILA|nr:unnamed protein product [Rotaria magnacalcarata]